MMTPPRSRAGFNALLKHLPPLVIAVALTLEPLVGGFIGFFSLQGVQPGMWTYVGGAIMMVAMVVTTVASHRREQHVVMKRNASLALVQAFGSPSD